MRGLDGVLEELEGVTVEGGGFFKKFGEEGVGFFGGEEVVDEGAGGVAGDVLGGEEVEGFAFFG